MGAPKQIEFEVEIEGRKVDFVFDKWGTFKVYKYFPLIGNYFAVPVSMLVGKGEEGFAEELPSALMLLFQTMQEKDVMQLFQLILEGTYTNSRTVDVSKNIEAVFQDDPSALLEVVARVLAENYQCFFKSGITKTNNPRTSAYFFRNGIFWLSLNPTNGADQLQTSWIFHNQGEGDKTCALSLDSHCSQDIIRWAGILKFKSQCAASVAVQSQRIVTISTPSLIDIIF